MSWIQTNSGHVFDFEDLSNAYIDLDDIIHAICHLPRFGGHVGDYTVGHHSYLCYSIARRIWPTDDVVHRACLVHDFHEAYIGDVPSPLGRLLGGVFKELHNQCAMEVGRRLGTFPHTQMTRTMVKEVDLLALKCEASVLHRTPPKTWGLPDGASPVQEDLNTVRQLYSCGSKEMIRSLQALCAELQITTK